MAIVAIGLLDGRIVQRPLGMAFLQGFCRDLMTVMCGWRFAVLCCADRRRGGEAVRTDFRDGHPCAGPHAQGHQAKQKAKEKSTHI